MSESQRIIDEEQTDPMSDESRATEPFRVPLDWHPPDDPAERCFFLDFAGRIEGWRYIGSGPLPERYEFPIPARSKILGDGEPDDHAPNRTYVYVRVGERTYQRVD